MPRYPVKVDPHLRGVSAEYVEEILRVVELAELRSPCRSRTNRRGRTTALEARRRCSALCLLLSQPDPVDQHHLIVGVSQQKNAVATPAIPA